VFWGRKEVITRMSRAEPADLIRLYLRHTPFYELFHTQALSAVPRTEWADSSALLLVERWENRNVTGLFNRYALEDPRSARDHPCATRMATSITSNHACPTERLVAIDAHKKSSCT